MTTAGVLALAGVALTVLALAWLALVAAVSQPINEWEQ